jgi:hypothetical protein
VRVADSLGDGILLEDVRRNRLFRAVARTSSAQSGHVLKSDPAPEFTAVRVVCEA